MVEDTGSGGKLSLDHRLEPASLAGVDRPFCTMRAGPGNRRAPGDFRRVPGSLC